MASAFPEEGNDELWQECAAWLTRWEMLRSDHRANWPEACIADLANILRDGVLLCKLLYKMDHSSIDMKDINLKPTLAQFLCLRNINVFLRTCLSSFSLKESELFEPLMLFDLTNFHKVLCTLSKLSTCPKALRSGIPGFAAQKVKSKEEEVIYQSLKTVEATSNPLYSNLSWLNFTIKSPRPDDREEDAYDNLCYVTFSSTLTEEPPTMEKRDFVIKELMDTENNYVEVLNKLNTNFVINLAGSMRPQDHETIFHKIPDLLKVHTDFNKELSRVRYDPSVRLSSIFMQWREKFLVYGSYCANLTKAINTLQEICDTDAEMNNLIESYEKMANNGKFKLRDVLSVPMQRILKYHLLLEKLIENTDVNHEEHNDLRRAREAMIDVAGYINEAARDKDHLDVIANLQENIIEWSAGNDINLSDYGRLIKDGEIKFKAHDDQKTKNRYVFIFDKCILICKQQKGQQFAFRDLINIADFHVDEAHNRALLNREARWSYNFHLVKNDTNTAYTFFVRSIELKDQMIKAINDALDNIRPSVLKRTTHSFELQTFQKPEQCNHCSKYLKGLIFQGYRCLVCKIAVHKMCLAASGKCGGSGSFCSMSSSSSSPQNSIINDEDAHLRSKLWFVGEMDRETAQRVLEKRENGTYLVRIRPKSAIADKYALSLKTDDSVKHMKICSGTDTGEKKYYLSWSKFFNSIEELIVNYQIFSLKENFERLSDDTKLIWPYKQLLAIAIRNFQPQDYPQIPLREGLKVIVIGKEGYREGWWKGRTDLNNVGYFPSNCVREEGEVRYD
ncbi:protein vav isoform X2 [Harmonia axyridis]|uniref:protein vav isoform X2 n=1 Tax=Harmonia axyridis TaxID=115357 RepID=UPI001E278EE5|nr:protein vav isoform X2 [Harmonia axyridis]